MTRSTGTLIKFTIFGLVMAVLTAFLFVVFSETRTGSTEGYSAVFEDASRLKEGDSVRIAGIRVGTVKGVSLQADRKVLVEFDADTKTKLTTGTKAAIRYLNLVGGDRYLELIDTPDSVKILPAGAQIPVERTAPALDLDLLLGGLKPVIQGAQPRGCQRAHHLAGPDTAGTGRHPRITAVQVVVVHELTGRQQPGHRAADRQSAHGARHPVPGR